MQRQKTEMSQMTNKPTYAKALMTGPPSSRKTKVHLHLHHHHHHLHHHHYPSRNWPSRAPSGALGGTVGGTAG